MSRKHDAADMLIDGQPPSVVAAATGLKLTTVVNIKRRLDSPIPGDPNFRGRGIIKCKLCGQACANHPLEPCRAAAD